MPSLLLSALADRLDPPPARDVYRILGYEPACVPRVLAQRRGDSVIPEPCGQCPQELFHTATEYDVLYGGAAGGGKTKGLLMFGLRACDAHPGLRVGAFRRTYDELEESFFKELQLIDYASDLGCRWHGTRHELTFPNRALIRFRYLDSIKSATRRQGGEYQLVLVDERTLIPPAAVSIVIDERIRSGNTTIPVIGVRSATNPGGVGHGEVRKRYIVPTEYGAKTVTDDQDRTVRFIQAKVKDNPYVDSGYVRRLEGIPDLARRRAMLDGDWDTFAGQFFPEWRHDTHVIRPPADWAERSKAWPKIAAVDWGYAAPWAVVWGARDFDGRMWIYRELYATEVGEADQARRIVAAEKPGEVKVRMADPSMWSKRGDAFPIADVYAREGCVVMPATNDRQSGWQRVHSYLDMGPACELHAEAGLTECPMLHVFDTCPNLVRTLPDQVHDDVDVEDLDTDGEDHAVDSLRYLLMRAGLRPPREPPKALDMSAEARMQRYVSERTKPNRPTLVGG